MSEFREIDTSRNRTPIEVPHDVGPAPTLNWISIECLLLDDSYQRPLLKSNWAAIRKIAENFSWSRFQPIVVAPVEGGKFAIVDGQHRAHAAKLIGVESLPAMSCHLTSAEQASAFAWINGNTTKITPFHVYKAALAAMEPWALQARNAVEAAGCRLMTSNKSAPQKRAGEVFSLALVRKYVESGEAEVVTAGLQALRNCETGDSAEMYTAAILKPWLSALRTNQQFLRLALVEVLNTHDLFDVLDEADAKRKRPGNRHLTRHALMVPRIIGILKDARRPAEKARHG